MVIDYILVVKDNDGKLYVKSYTERFYGTILRALKSL